jgi:hypothetical protein
MEADALEVCRALGKQETPAPSGAHEERRIAAFAECFRSGPVAAPLKI